MTPHLIKARDVAGQQRIALFGGEVARGDCGGGIALDRFAEDEVVQSVAA